MSHMIASKSGCSPNMTIICDNARILSRKKIPRKRRPAYLRSQSIPEFSPTRSSRWQSLTTSNDLPKQESESDQDTSRPRPSFLRSQSIQGFTSTKCSRWQSLTHNERPNQEGSPSLTMPRRSPSKQGESPYPTMPKRKASLGSTDYSSMLDDDISPSFSVRKSKADSSPFLLGL
jgi:hypothetical protein